VNSDKAVLLALRRFADAVTAKMTTSTAGDPEDQLRAPLEAFLRETGKALALKLVCTGETPLPDRMGKPDYAVHVAGLLAGYVELKAPGSGATPSRFKGHSAQQWKRFRAMPNLLYSDGNEWGLYRAGQAVRPVIRLTGDVTTDGKTGVKAGDAQALLGVLTDFFQWQPTIPQKLRGQVDLEKFADLLAPLCRLLREDVTDALKDPRSPLVQLAAEWRQLLFPDADDERFADAYAQTVTFALLLARSQGADPLARSQGADHRVDLSSAEATLAVEHSLLSRALQVLTDPNAQAAISASLNLLIRVIAEVPPEAMTVPENPWFHFYEDFLGAYDPKLRKDAGAYYTPVEVVHAQVRLIDDLLTNRLGKALGFADPEVVTLDPAVGTGTYLLGVIDHALNKVKARQGAGAVPGQATALGGNLYGFEMMVGPYAVAELRVTRALLDRGAKLPSGGTHVYLTDTLESPNATPPQLPLYLKPIADQHRKALDVKETVPVIVCLGNPPYDRHEAADESNKARTGHWVRWGDDGKGTDAIFKDFVDPVIESGHGVHAKWLYNQYVYFWRWALWKVFEHRTATGPGVVSFISASSYLFSDAFCGMREHMRRVCDEIWILDLGGEGRGGRKDENVFAIQTPVAIAVAVRYGKADKDTPARVHYGRIHGKRHEKLTALAAVDDLAALTWEDCPSDWAASFLPGGQGGYFTWPIVRDLFPWQHSGSQLFRSWPIAPDAATLEARWRGLLRATNRAVAFRETRDRQIDKAYRPLLPLPNPAKPVAALSQSDPCPEVARYAFRSFDRQYVIADSRVGDVMKPVLWEVAGDPAGPAQLFITSQLWQVLGDGPALTVSIYVPDFHHFKGSYGGKDAIPLYRDGAGKEPNILPGLLDVLAKGYGRNVTPEDFLAYVYGALAHPAFTERYAKELETRELRVPLTKDTALFAQVREVGARLLWLHTYGQRFVPKGHRVGEVPKGAARCTKSVPGNEENYPENCWYNDLTKTVYVGEGEFAPVQRAVYEFEVSGLKVVQSWLKYRMKHGGGKKSSPLDDIRPERWTGEFTTELLELLWVLEATLAEYPAQAKLLSAVVNGPLLRADELPTVPDAARRPPSGQATRGLFADVQDD